MKDMGSQFDILNCLNNKCLFTESINKVHYLPQYFKKVVEEYKSNPEAVKLKPLEVSWFLRLIFTGYSMLV